MRECRWLKPVLVEHCEFAEWRPESHLRHSNLLALREAKDAKEVRREQRTNNIKLFWPTLCFFVFQPTFTTPTLVRS
jgi:ATP-dependent DNA ligase